MSGGKESNAYDIQMRAARWVVEQQAADDWSGEDQGRLQAWLDESTAHSVAYWRAKYAWSRTDRVAALKSPSPDTWSRQPRKKSRYTVLRVAAALGGLVMIGVAAVVLL